MESDATQRTIEALPWWQWLLFLACMPFIGLGIMIGIILAPILLGVEVGLDSVDSWLRKDSALAK